MNDLDGMLSQIRIEGVKAPLTIGVSYGFTDFVDTSELETAVKSADEEMYVRKQSRKNTGNETPPASFLAGENASGSLRT
jgi:hypothetical protein